MKKIKKEIVIYWVLVLFAIIHFVILVKMLFVLAEMEEPEIEHRPIYIYVTHRTPGCEMLNDPPIETTPRENKKASRGSVGREFTITAYDNSVESQGQWVDQTATGFNLKGHTLESAKCLAVDPKVIPLGSKVELTFDDEYKHLDGIYIARDTGGAIKGHRIDLFMGDGVDKKKVTNFGRRKVQARIVK